MNSKLETPKRVSIPLTLEDLRTIRTALHSLWTTAVFNNNPEEAKKFGDLWDEMTWEQKAMFGTEE